jgi:uncharacterized protein (DUF1778 family)
MVQRKRPVTVSTRTTRLEKALLEAAATSEGLPLSEWLHRLAVPEARRRLSRELAAHGAPEALLQ